MARQKKLKPGQTYYVEWLDAYSGPNTWLSEDEIETMTEGDYTCWTLGWLYKENANYYVFCSTTSKCGDKRGAVWAIPKGMIISVKEVMYG